MAARKFLESADGAAGAVSAVNQIQWEFAVDALDPSNAECEPFAAAG
jgi:hypothetical protein